MTSPIRFIRALEVLGEILCCFVLVLVRGSLVRVPWQGCGDMLAELLCYELGANFDAELGTGRTQHLCHAPAVSSFPVVCIM